MSETIRGHHTTTQTLSAATPSVTIAGAITAYGPAGLYPRQGPTTRINAALFAPATASFNILNQGYIGAVIPGSPHPVIDYGIALGAAAILTNTGTITGPAGIGAFGTAKATILNAGLITTSYYAGIDAFNAPASIDNTGTIAAQGIGIQLHQGGDVQNTGVISGSLAGIAAYGAPLSLVNTGTITSLYGLALNAGGQITDSGLISGSGVAIKDTGQLSLILTPGARLTGAVDDISGGGALTLAGVTAGELNIGIDFFGMPNITFAPGATWTLEGSTMDLAAGQTITGFSAADTLVLDGFAATSGTFGAAGLTLANASATTTLGINALPLGRGLAVHAYFGNTTLKAAALPTINIISTISTYENSVVTPGYGSFAETLTIASAGTLASGADVFGAATLTNSGEIKGGVTLGAPGLILNQGNIAGVYATAGGTLLNAGAIGAILATGALSLIIDPGARFSGNVVDTSGTGQLTLSGSSAAYLALGGFSGFSNLSFAAGSTWTLEGSLTKQTISGFAPADTLILAGFAATSYSLAPGIGIILSNATSAETLALGTLATDESFALASAFNKTTLTGTIGIPPLIIGTDTSIGLIASSGESITITPTGTIATAGPAIYIGSSVSNLYILNEGALRTPGTPLPAIYGNGSFLTIRNAGTIEAQQGVYLRHQGTLLNSGQIAGAATDYGVRMAGSSLANSGTIAALADGVIAFNSCAVTNSGTISGAEFGVILDASKLTNTGTIASSFTALDLLSYGSLINSGLVTSTAYGIQGLGLGFLTNTGSIWGDKDGAALDYSSSSFFTGGFTDTSLASTLFNTGSIGGGTYGLKLGSGLVDVINAGTISGGLKAIQAGGRFTLTAEPGAVFNGAVADAASAGELILAGNRPGSLDIAPDFEGFATLAFAARSRWTLEGTPTQLAGGETIAGFAPGDTIVLDSFAAASDMMGAGGLTLSGRGTTETLAISGISQFTVADNADGGTDVSVACFCRGTRISTLRGNLPVEKLRIGGLVRTMHGELPIRWIGRRTYAARFIRNNPDALPIRIRRHAIAPNVPSRDLYVSPDHAICEGGVLIHAHLLQNGISFHQPEALEDVEYFHLEFDRHTIVFAENFSVESFIDEGAANRFQNRHTRLASSEPQKPCLPRVFEGFHLHNIKSRIARRAGIPVPTALGPLRGVIDECTPTLIRGWAQNSMAPEQPVTLEIFSGAYQRTIIANAYRPDLRLAGIGSGCHGFSLTLPNLQHPVRIRRASDGAILPPPVIRHCERAKRKRSNPEPNRGASGAADG